MAQNNYQIAQSGLLDFFNAARGEMDKQQQMKMRREQMAAEAAQNQAQQAYQQEQLGLAKSKEGREASEFAETMKYNRDKLAQDARLANTKARSERGPGNKSLDKAFDLSQKFAGEPAVKRAQEMSEAITKLKSGVEAENAAGDISLVYGFMRLNDPTSTVREGEYATAQNSGSVPENIRNAYNKALSGEKLSPDQRRMFYNQGIKMYQGHLKTVDPISSQYEQFSRGYGVDPNQVVRRFESPGLMPEPAQEPGFLQKAAGFLGIGSQSKSVAGDRITVTNGKETYSIPASDLKDAEASGFKAVK